MPIHNNLSYTHESGFKLEPTISAFSQETTQVDTLITPISNAYNTFNSNTNEAIIKYFGGFFNFFGEVETDTPASSDSEVSENPPSSSAPSEAESNPAKMVSAHVASDIVGPHVFLQLRKMLQSALHEQLSAIAIKATHDMAAVDEEASEAEVEIAQEAAMKAVMEAANSQRMLEKLELTIATTEAVNTISTAIQKANAEMANALDAVLIKAFNQVNETKSLVDQEAAIIANNPAIYRLAYEAANATMANPDDELVKLNNPPSVEPPTLKMTEQLNVSSTLLSGILLAAKSIAIVIAAIAVGGLVGAAIFLGVPMIATPAVGLYAGSATGAAVATATIGAMYQHGFFGSSEEAVSEHTYDSSPQTVTA